MPFIIVKLLKNRNELICNSKVNFLQHTKEFNSQWTFASSSFFDHRQGYFTEPQQVAQRVLSNAFSWHMLLPTQIQRCLLLGWRFSQETCFFFFLFILLYSFFHSDIHSFMLTAFGPFQCFHQRPVGSIKGETQTKLRPSIYFDKIFGRKSRLKI